jgi:hypothetical protein
MTLSVLIEDFGVGVADTCDKTLGLKHGGIYTNPMKTHNATHCFKAEKPFQDSPILKVFRHPQCLRVAARMPWSIG